MVWRFSHVPKPGTLVSAVCAVVALAVFAPEQADSTMEYNEAFSNVKKAALMLKSDSQCAVLTSLLHTPQVEWYSGCETTQIDHAAHNLKPNISPDATLYLLLAETADGQPQSVLIDRYVTETSAAPITVGNSGSRFRQVEIWKVSD